MGTTSAMATSDRYPGVIVHGLVRLICGG
jgi:hypothetical protein